MKFVLAVTTLNRYEYVRYFFESFFETYNPKYEWIIIIADDGSEEKTLNYLKEIDFKEKIIIENKNRGISHQTNCIFQKLEEINFDVCFKCDDDIFFKEKEWDYKYANAICKTEFKHICYDNPNFNIGKWCEDGKLEFKIEKKIKDVVFHALTKNTHVKGCFYTVTPEILKKIGYMDTKNFLHGFEHIDFTMRCSRLKFCDPLYAYDLIDSNNYIGYRFPWSQEQTSLAKKKYIINGNGKFSTIKKKHLINDQNRIFIPFCETKKTIRNDILL